MPGVVIRGGNVGHQNVANFDKYGNVQNCYLLFGNIYSNETGYETMAPGFIGGITVRASEVVGSDVRVYVEKNDFAFFDVTLPSGNFRYAESFDVGEHEIDSLDVLSCRVSGGISKNIKIQLKIM